MIGRLHHTIIDTSDPQRLANFYSRLLGWPVAHHSPDFVVVIGDETRSGLGFQLVPDHQAPRWPDPRHPQQIHLDVMVDDLERASIDVEQLGAVSVGANYIYADPSGHPFCLIPRPGWADPIHPYG